MTINKIRNIAHAHTDNVITFERSVIKVFTVNQFWPPKTEINL